MKKFWKALGIAALAAVVPVRVQKDEETGKKTFQSLLWKLDVTPGPGNSGTEIGLDLMEGVLTRPILNAVTAKREAALFADDEPDAAVVAQMTADEAQLAADEAQAAADEAQALADQAQAAADEAQALADEAQTAADEAAEDDFDPEF